MAYEPKPGSFSLFKNDKKEKDNHPDYRGDGLDLNGTPVWISAWIKEGKNGKFMSCSMQAKTERPMSQRASSKPATVEDLDDDIPF